jgi:serine/threonine protein kinase/Tol biopolymer transport system component
MSLSAGTRLGPYEIVALLGAGGMGEVYRATDPRLRREVAIKVLPAGIAGDAARVRRFEQEALAAAGLNHPNILAVYDIGIHEGAPYIVSELLDGGTLRETLASGAPSVRRVLDLAVQIAKGLAAAHEKGIVHRDLKPENLFVTKDGRVKILDFGLAKLTQKEPATGGVTNLLTAVPATEPGMIVGTVGYMSPEQVRGEPADHRSDIFSFALVLYELLAGQRAFAAPSVVETMNAILTREPPDLVRPGGAVPPALDRIVRRCLEKSPEQRFQSAQDLAFNLEALSSDSESRAAAAAPTARSARPGPRSRALAMTIAVVLLVVVASGAGFLIARRGAQSPLPTFTRLTFRRGTIRSARFAPDGQTVVYSAAWQGQPVELFSTLPGSSQPRTLGSGLSIVSMSSTGEMALRLSNGTLARAALAGGAPRDVVERVSAADWSPDGQTLAIVRAAGGRTRLEFPLGTVLYETAGQISNIAVAPDAASIAFVESPPGIGPMLSVRVVDRQQASRTLSDGWRSVQGLAWSRRGDEVWFAASKSSNGGGALFGVTTDGRVREVVKIPGELALYDVRGDGKILIGRVDRRLEAIGLPAGDAQERDISWFDFNGLSDISRDGRTILVTVDGANGLKTYLRKFDDSPAVELGEGGSFGFSPDERSMLVQTTSLRFGVVPVGAGERRYIPHPGFDGYLWANWFPDGKRILFAGSETGHRLRLYVENLDGSQRHAITPEGTFIRTGSHAISPDGTRVAAVERGQIMLYPVDGGAAPVPVPGLSPGDVPSRWGPDGRSLYVYRQDELPARVFRVDVASGRKELWKTLGPSDPAGVTGLAHVIFTPDGTSYIYNYLRLLSDLYLVEGLK